MGPSLSSFVVERRRRRGRLAPTAEREPARERELAERVDRSEHTREPGGPRGERDARERVDRVARERQDHEDAHDARDLLRAQRERTVHEEVAAEAEEADRERVPLEAHERLHDRAHGLGVPSREREIGGDEEPCERHAPDRVVQEHHPRAERCETRLDLLEEDVERPRAQDVAGDRDEVADDAEADRGPRLDEVRDEPIGRLGRVEIRRQAAGDRHHHARDRHERARAREHRDLPPADRAHHAPAFVVRSSRARASSPSSTSASPCSNSSANE
jgi:hypothetical protein